MWLYLWFTEPSLIPSSRRSVHLPKVWGHPKVRGRPLKPVLEGASDATTKARCLASLDLRTVDETVRDAVSLHLAWSGPDSILLTGLVFKAGLWNGGSVTLLWTRW